MFQIRREQRIAMNPKARATCPVRLMARPLTVTQPIIKNQLYTQTHGVQPPRNRTQRPRSPESVPLGAAWSWALYTVSKSPSGVDDDNGVLQRGGATRPGSAGTFRPGPFRRLHVGCAGCRLLMSCVPPRDSGTTWSTCITSNGSGCLQIPHRPECAACNCLFEVNHQVRSQTQRPFRPL